MRILSWNINSVRLRRRAVSKLLRDVRPDVVCLQETKVVDDLFPCDLFSRLGYVHQALSGQKSYHGVAVLSQVPFASVAVRVPCRHQFVSFTNGVELHNVYAPAGGDVPDPAVNPKFAYKMAFYRSITSWFRRRSLGHAVLVGDLNIAPLPTDVWSHRQLVRVVTHTPREVAALERLQQTLGWVDAVRAFVPPSEKIFTWWSYRAADWRKVDKGRRLDHAWVSPSLSSSLRSADVLTRVRGWKLPSDHVPLILNLEL